jgi:phosphonoacetaldehyde hydrolase
MEIPSNPWAFREPIRAVMFDWAGTTIDFGSRAPTEAFRAIFKGRGVEATIEEARGPMGMSKREHLAAMLAMPSIAEQWRRVHGTDAGDEDVDAMYQEFLPLQRSTLAAHCDVIDGVPEVVAQCRQRGLAIGSSTGYTRELMEVVKPLAAKQGYAPDCCLCADDVPAGRPAPWLIFAAAQRLNIYPMASIVIVDDTRVGIEAGLNAGCWTVAVAATGNEMGLSREQSDSLANDERDRRLSDVRRRCRDWGAHFVIDSASALSDVLDRLDEDRRRRV